ncbi:uncharacterized protein LOC108485837 [Gossypium arboreum]|uniref:Phorbol-ester/DAG-type domain-containing protein n=1 Tax=Gossypium arboreum TaxID=29729 RepID=A0ABR0PQ48_GOSAR|nr:uncharacterized protein LOC108485837 [Gossypium arboreum]KAK5826568.1 hypothetical protein PVK06_021493 [Gossypium arboreum]
MEITHPFHEEHPLVLVTEQSNEGLKAYCDGCGELLSTPCFTCIHCNYHLHKQCAEAPLQIPNHPIHPKHSDTGFFLRQRPYLDDHWVNGCALCKEKRNMFFYECYSCYFFLDIKCAHLSSSYKFSQLSKYDIHKHPLTFIESHMAIDVLKNFNCLWCHEPLTYDIYFCSDCPSFIAHKKCLNELPTKINHPSHHIHPLFLNYSYRNHFCNLCQKEHSGHFYCCSLCHFNIKLECALLRSIIEDKRSHQHPFSLLWRQGSFICDACDTEGNYISYICLKCYIVVHKKCISLPRVIKFSRHDHCIFHKYFLETQELTKQDCKICFKKVKLDRGSYSCGKPGCNYVVHVNCVLENEKLYEVIEDEKQYEELYEKSIQSSAIRVIEVNEAGEATKIEHFSHQHRLVLADKMEEEIDRKCDGCMLSISTIFYYCSECPFFLHKTCAELPKIKRHWFRQWNAILDFKGFLACSLCRQHCNGFFYRIKGWQICIRCAKVADIIECEGHQHFLFFDFKCKEKCNGCGNKCWFGAFRCGECRFVLDFGCLTLPQSALHKIDEHILNITYDDDKKQSWCDICEQERDPSLWYYSCSICDTSAHPKCVLGKFPFLKDGSTFSSNKHNHHHDLKFFKKVEGYPECSYCGKLSHEEILKCKESTCDYILHCKCLDY